MLKAVMIGAFALAGVTSQASAEPYKVTFSGYVDAGYSGTSTPRDDRNLIPGVKLGDQFTVSYFYDQKSLSTISPSGPILTYTSGFQRAELSIGDVMLTLEKNPWYQYVTFREEVDYQGEKFQSLNFAFNTFPGGGALTSDIFGTNFSVAAPARDFFDGNENILLGEEYSSDLRDHGDFFRSSGNLFGTNGNSSFLHASFKAMKLTVRSVAAVPEPATWMMMIVGFGVIGRTMRRRGKNPLTV